MTYCNIYIEELDEVLEGVEYSIKGTWEYIQRYWSEYCETLEMPYGAEYETKYTVSIYNDEDELIEKTEGTMYYENIYEEEEHGTYWTLTRGGR